MTLNNNIAYIGVGSNISPKENITAALKLLREKVKILKISTIYKSEPLYNKKNNYFLNGVWKIETCLSPLELKYNLLRKIEKKLFRKRTEDRNAPRSIDLDLLLYADMVIKENGLIIPDPDIPKRPFIYIPLFELDPELIIPGLGLSIKEILTQKNKNKMGKQNDFTRKLRVIIN